MRVRSLLAVVIACTLPASPAGSQVTSFAPTFVRTYSGCAPGISCHLVTVMWQHDPSGYITGTVRAQSFFQHNPWGAGYPYRLIVSSFPWPAWAFSDEYFTLGGVMEPMVDETFLLDTSGDGAIAPGTWRPHWLQMTVIYGLPAGEPGLGPYSERIMLSATPEPASMLLLGTGLGALALARRRRKRVE